MQLAYRGSKHLELSSNKRILPTLSRDERGRWILIGDIRMNSKDSNGWTIQVTINHHYAEKDGFDVQVEIYQHGERLTLIEQEEYDGRKAAILEHEDVSEDRAEEILEDQGYMTFEFARAVHGWDFHGAAQELLDVWKALKLLVCPAVGYHG